MNEQRFTPGPWKVLEHSWCETSIVADGFDHGICGLDINHATEESQEADEAMMAANARLIAAAPDMLAALQEAFSAVQILQYVADNNELPGLPRVIENMRAAIARALPQVGEALALADSEGSRAVAYLRRARKAEAALAAIQSPAPAFERALELRIQQGWQLGGNACPILYTDEINGQQVCRDDLWIATTAGLKGSPATPAVAVQAEPGPWHFHRFVGGEERAEDVLIENATSLTEAMRTAARICPKRPMTVLVHVPAAHPKPAAQSEPVWCDACSQMVSTQCPSGMCEMKKGVAPERQDPLSRTREEHSPGLASSIVRWKNLDAAMADPLFQSLRGVMGTANHGQDEALFRVLSHFEAAHPKPAAPATADEAVSDVNVALEAVDVLYALTLQQSTPAQRIDAKIALKRAILALRSGASAQHAEAALKEAFEEGFYSAQTYNDVLVNTSDAAWQESRTRAGTEQPADGGA